MAKKRYKNMSDNVVLGHAPGETFEADLPEEQEEALKWGGTIRVVKDLEKDEPPKQRRY